MRVLVSASGHVDFERPIFVWPGQREKFLAFLQDLLGEPVELVEREEPERRVGSRDVEPKPWTARELAELTASEEDNDALAAKLGRSEMSVRMKRGDFPPGFGNWLADAGLSMPATLEEITSLVEKYLGEKEGH